MISIKRTGICQGCLEADLYIEKIFVSNRAEPSECFCKHQAACGRAWDLGFEEGRKPVKEEGEPG